MNHFDLVVTRHAGLVEYLKEQGITCDIILPHVQDPSILEGKDVLGILPVNMAAMCNSFTELALDIPQELRGKELDLEQVRQYAIGFFTYKITIQ